MLTPTFGVTSQWYAQFSLRLLKHWSSFWGEAHVHAGASADHQGIMSADRLRVCLRDAWFKVSLVSRLFDMGAATGFRLDRPITDLLRENFGQYEKHMQDRRLRQIKALGPLGEQARVIVFDGNQKLTRR
eukprot:9829742-Lingulodinium_polyedra.AAC.1